MAQRSSSNYYGQAFMPMKIEFYNAGCRNFPSAMSVFFRVALPLGRHFKSIFLFCTV